MKAKICVGYHELLVQHFEPLTGHGSIADPPRAAQRDLMNPHPSSYPYPCQFVNHPHHKSKQPLQKESEAFT